MAVLTINSGSSSLKASLFKADGARRDFSYQHIGHGFPHDHHEAFAALLADLGDDRPAAVGHRLVHGGNITDTARLIDAAERARLENIIHLAPLHMPGNLLGVDLCLKHFDVLQVACFDTAFHSTLPEISWRLPIPAELGYRRYGFHGINYAHIARQLPQLIGDIARGRVVIAHLGNGASLCLMENLQSIDTSMCYTPAGGVPMGTRSGDLDPGLVLELSRRFESVELEELIYQRMGLLALSDGISNEMSELLASESSSSRFAIEYFSRQIRAAIGAYAAKSGGIDALVFTGGIGEHSALVRAMICEPLAFMGFALDEQANQNHHTFLNLSSSKPVLMVTADEEIEIARMTKILIG